MNFIILNTRTGMYLCDGTDNRIWASSQYSDYLFKDSSLDTMWKVATALTIATQQTHIVKDVKDIFNAPSHL